MTAEELIKRLTRKEEKLKLKGYRSEVIEYALNKYLEGLLKDFNETASQEDIKLLEELRGDLGKYRK